MHEGRIVGRFARDQVDAETIVRAALASSGEAHR
jgi:hypothetical protein